MPAPGRAAGTRPAPRHKGERRNVQPKRIAGVDRRGSVAGIVEAQAAGCPVIAYQAGGALETVVDGVTGLFFPEQSTASLSEAVKRFEDTSHCFRAADLVENARRFSKSRFVGSFREFVGS